MPGGSGLHPLGEPFSKLGPTGAAAWRLLQTTPWIRESDFGLAPLFADGLDRRARLLRALDRAAATTAGSTGQVRAHPLFAEVLALEKSLAEWGRALLLDPGRKAELGIAESKALSKLDELRARQAARSGRTVGDA
jgi:hypothetical protein